MDGRSSTCIHEGNTYTFTQHVPIREADRVKNRPGSHQFCIPVWIARCEGRTGMDGPGEDQAVSRTNYRLIRSCKRLEIVQEHTCELTPVVGWRYWCRRCRGGCRGSTTESWGSRNLEGLNNNVRRCVVIHLSDIVTYRVVPTSTSSLYPHGLQRQLCPPEEHARGHTLTAPRCGSRDVATSCRDDVLRREGPALHTGRAKTRVSG